MAANDYYTIHPQNPITSTFTPQSSFHWNVSSNGRTNITATNTSYEPYRHRVLSQLPHYQQQQYPLAIPTGPVDLSTSPSPSYLSTSLPSDTTTTSDRSLFSSSVGSSSCSGGKKSKSERAIKFVEKQVKKQVEKKLNGGKYGGQEQQELEQGYEDYGSQGVGQQDQSSGGGGGDYGYVTGDGGGYGPTGNYGGDDGVKFDWDQDAGGWFGDLDLGGLESVLGG